MTFDYRIDQELAAIALEWRDRDGAVRDFASGWTFTVYVVDTSDDSTVLTKTAGITVDDATPNVLIEWSAADLVTISEAVTLPALCSLVVYARRDSDSKDDVFPGSVIVRFSGSPA